MEIMELGQRLQTYRESQKITQAEMAQACDLSKNYISAMERGVHKCSAQTLIGYAKKLNISLDELVGYENSGYILPELKRKIASLDFDKQRKILKTIEIFEK